MLSAAPWCGLEEILPETDFVCTLPGMNRNRMSKGQQKYERGQSIILLEGFRGGSHNGAHHGSCCVCGRDEPREAITLCYLLETSIEEIDAPKTSLRHQLTFPLAVAENKRWLDTTI